MNDPKPGWLTSEAWATAGTVAVQLVLLFVMLGWIKQSDQESITNAVTGGISSLGLCLSNCWMLWSYIRSRTEIKKQDMAVKSAAFRAEKA